MLVLKKQSKLTSKLGIQKPLRNFEILLVSLFFKGCKTFPRHQINMFKLPKSKVVQKHLFSSQRVFKQHTLSIAIIINDFEQLLTLRTVAVQILFR